MKHILNVGLTGVLGALLLCWSVESGWAQQEGMRRIAVMELTISGEKMQPPDLHIIIQDWLTSFLVETRAFEIIEREQLEKILAEQTLGQTGLIDTESASEVGKILGVDVLVTGKVIRLGDTVEVSVRVIDASNGAILDTASVVTDDMDELRSEIQELADIIQRKLSQGETAEETMFHETFAGTELDTTRWYSYFDEGFTNTDQKNTRVVVQDDVLRVTGQYKKTSEDRFWGIEPALEQPYHSLEATIRVRELQGGVSICAVASWDDGDAWSAICPYLGEDGTDIEFGIDSDDDDDISVLEFDFETEEWYTIRLDYMNGEFLYYWNGTLVKRIDPELEGETLTWSLGFSLDDTRSVVAEIDEIFLR